MQTLNKENINFTTESLKLFNVDNKETLKTDKEKESLIKEKPLFVRAMGSAKMMSFIKIDIKDVPKNNIVITKFTSKKALQANLTFREIKQKNNQQ